MAATPGSTADLMARYIGQRLNKLWNSPVIVENRSGASATLAATAVAQAEPDGHTLLMGETGSLGTAGILYQKRLQYDPIKDLAAITLVERTPLVVLVNPSFQAKNLRELVDYAKQNPNKLNYSSGGQGTTAHLTSALLALVAGIEVVHVPFRGAAAGVTAIMTGEAQFASIAASSAMPHINSGRVRAIAITGRNRHPSLPDISTGIEAGLPGFESEVWFGLLAPKRTPESLVRRLNKEVVEILNMPETKTAFLKLGGEASPTSPQEFERFIQSEIVKWEKVIKTAGIQIN